MARQQGKIDRALKAMSDDLGSRAPLLEVVRTPLTSAAVIRTAMELSRPLKKTPVLAGVCGTPHEKRERGEHERGRSLRDSNDGFQESLLVARHSAQSRI